MRVLVSGSEGSVVCLLSQRFSKTVSSLKEGSSEIYAYRRCRSDDH